MSIEGQSPLQTQTIEYRDGDTACEAYAAWDPSITTPRPCIVVAPAWDGFNHLTRATVERLARMGYLGYSIDIYGKDVRGVELGDNTAIMEPFLRDRAMLRTRVLAGLRNAQSHPMAIAHETVAIGYCFGGQCVLDLARAVPPGLKGVVSFHGVYTPPNLGPQPDITAKVLVLHGWADQYVPTTETLVLGDELTAAGADWQMISYGHAMHAFTHKGKNKPEAGIGYNADADRRSWIAMTTFLDEVLGTPTPR